MNKVAPPTDPAIMETVGPLLELSSVEVPVLIIMKTTAVRSCNITILTYQLLHS